MLFSFVEVIGKIQTETLRDEDIDKALISIYDAHNIKADNEMLAASLEDKKAFLDAFAQGIDLEEELASTEFLRGY